MAEIEQAQRAEWKPSAETRMTSAKVDKIVPALIKVQQSIKTVTKTKVAHKYKYADLADCFDEALPKLNENGTALTQVLWPDKTGATKLWSLLLHTSGQWIASQHPLEPKDKTDAHAVASAITYARRYTFCAQVGITVAGEDDDAGAAMAAKPQTVAQPRPDKRYANQR